jgi:hypothetical protein
MSETKSTVLQKMRSLQHEKYHFDVPAITYTNFIAQTILRESTIYGLSGISKAHVRSTSSMQFVGDSLDTTEVQEWMIQTEGKFETATQSLYF